MKSGLFLLKALAIAGMFLLTAPVLVFAEVFSFKAVNPAHLALCYAWGCACFIIGLLLAVPFGKIKREKHIRTYLFFARIAAVSASFIILALPLSAQGGLLAATVFTGAYCALLGMKCLRSPFTAIHNVSLLGIYAFLSVIVMLFLNAYVPDLKSAQTVIIGVFLFEACVYAIILNQKNISEQVNRRLDIAPLIPKNLRLYNISLILVTAALFAFFFLFRSVIFSALSLIVECVLQTATALFKLLFSAVPESDDFAIPDIPQIEREDPANGLIGAIIFTVFTVISIIALINLRAEIISVIKDFFKKIAALFAPKERGVKSVGAYTDYFEDIAYEKKKKRGKSALKTCVKLYKREKNPLLKMRLSYRVFLLWLNKQGAELSPADTVEEHCGKAKEATGAAFAPYAGEYEKARYAGEVGEDALDLAEEVVRTTGAMK